MPAPELQRFDNVPETALDWHQAGKEAGKGAALATVVETWGSAPRRTGSQLAVASDGRIEGSVSGGCVEGAVILAAQEAIASGRHQVLEFGVSDEDAFAVGLACGGTIRILVEPIGGTLAEDTLAALVAARAERRAVSYVVDLDSGAGHLDVDGHTDRKRLDKSGVEADGKTFVAVHNPPLRLIVVGAVHIAQALVPMARIAGYDPVIIDPRAAFASAERFPGETLVEDWPDEAIAALGLDGRTAVVLLTHDPKIDDPALEAALRSECFYIGALGSTRTHAKRITRMQEAGFTEDTLQRIHGPIGLDIGAAGPAEIAVSIIAEMTAVLRGRRS
ncbi:XdhC family protein [Phaeobacter gallaeciensis]|uniref:Xanthine and CO dehydrogenase maturation factor, XdhC/CoxF family n=1 Tax=Phaeobacter gallaeciensis TaxID=60890 RepID=A0AAD0ECC6_9RHOB|nr:XdhC family protein [Phaeobacter gallaeciensis]AHD09081.1 Xanthine and CO dehydrogenase maturation factor, XdhC/CoxF family [Phaeobacter gallaeciensis DSM 26640]ATE92344.1 Xanthine and CO dehydrogenase maturation factor, XdhC/CoxF family [Phaeobacter gallaeciensis]ATE97834.1 Xanthine and CO dehydrogenase maturation factor, XdhC/CoxF family [Phaeobacter gallaeciensis]ATF01009.1 Xanthine and CO dehydrogenase maturation factor, XdhC/CoxF family [Phaeobacter gallaeciensis]ATF05389.1 Xanthine an